MLKPKTYTIMDAKIEKQKFADFLTANKSRGYITVGDIARLLNLSTESWECFDCIDDADLIETFEKEGFKMVDNNWRSQDSNYSFTAMPEEHWAAIEAAGRRNNLPY